MVYLSEDEITGIVNINIHASDDGKIINSTKSGQIIYKYGTNLGLCTNCTKFRKYSIANTRIEIESNNNGLNDFTMCAWVYPVKYDDVDFSIGNISSSDVFIVEPNNGRFCKNKWVRDTGVTNINYDYDYLRYTTVKATFNSWRHYAITKKGNTAYFFKDGKMIHSRTIPNENYHNFLSRSRFRIINNDNRGDGGLTLNNNFYLDDFVFISNQCLWTSDYVVPEEPLIGDVGNAEILWDNLNIFKANIPKDDDTYMFLNLY